jgi:DhnA family fructose-bisphosphate aldolase class Ia
VSFGKERRMHRIMGGANPTFVLPVDDGLISGPRMSLTDPRDLVRVGVEAGVASVLGYPGALRRCAAELGPVGFIQNLTCSTILSRHTEKILLSGVDDALRNGADAVAAHVNLSDDTEPIMLSNLGRLSEECRQADVPLFVLSYPRRQDEDGDENYASLRASSVVDYTALVAHCARVAVEVGADVVKVPYTGSAESFAEVVAAAMGTPVVVSGGAPVEDEGAIAVAAEAVRAGAAGVAYGRQTFMRPVADVARFVAEVLEAMKLERDLLPDVPLGVPG